MSNVKKPNQHLENLIKADGFLLLPHWYQKFVQLLIVLGQQTQPTAIFSFSDRLHGYIDALLFADVITGQAFSNLMKLKDEAEKYAINNNVKKAA